MNRRAAVILHEELAEVTVGNTAPLAWLSFGIESAVLYCFGRSAFRVEITRAPTGLNFMRVIVAPYEIKLGELEWSSQVSISELAALGHFPKVLIHPWAVASTQESTVVDLTGLRLEKGIGQIAFMFSEAAIDFFSHGATTVRLQCSLTRFQIWFNAPTLPKDFRAANFKPEDLITTLPWPKPS